MSRPKGIATGQRQTLTSTLLAKRKSCCRCGKVYGRHSNSLDVSKKCCGLCRARLEALGRFNADGTPAKGRAPSAYSLFVKV